MRSTKHCGIKSLRDWRTNTTPQKSSLSSSSFSKHFNGISVIILGRTTGTTFPVAINPHMNINTLYDTGAARSCMNYDTFFSLGLDLDEKAVPHVRTASGTNMGAIVFATLTFAINKHIFTKQFIACRSQTPYFRTRFLCWSLYRLHLDPSWHQEVHSK